MIVGDLVKILVCWSCGQRVSATSSTHPGCWDDYFYEDLIGVIVRIIRPHKAKQYWVRICDKNMGPYPFSINQLEKM